MSRLGIAFILPYVGSNGIKVVNNVIEIDPSGTAELGRLSLNVNQDQFGANLLTINTGAGGSPTANAAMAVINVPNNNLELGIDCNGTIDNSQGGNSDSEGVIVPSVTFQNSSTGFILGSEMSGTVVPDAAKFLPVILNGNEYKLIIST